MGKKKRLNKFINKWMKSDLPEEPSTVLLLGVTRIPTSPLPARRPFSLPTARQYPQICALSTLPRHPHPPPSVDICNDERNKDDLSRDVVVTMDRSVDSIGTCSLDVDASVEVSDWSENSSVATLRSTPASQKSPGVPESRLPSYLSLACTVNGYSTTTNYDPERLARSRDASPHRLQDHHENLTYSVQNNLLSPPNLVPLPMQKYAMGEHTITHHRTEYYSEFKVTRSFSSSLYKEEKFSNGVQTQTPVIREPVDNLESKSFIQQRVERLYGPGALAQGFLVINRQKNRNFETSFESDRHSKSMCDKLLEDSFLEGNIKQSTSTPSLPVLRHLTPEFRAQLPMLSPRRGDISMQKSNTIPVIKDTVNGFDKAVDNNNSCEVVNGHKEEKAEIHSNETVVKDGHHFLKVLETEAQRLLVLADKAEEELEGDETLSEDAKGFLRSAAGKARLLVSQKMQQFKGLCTKNITQVEGESFPTTNEDLQGFWDMVMLQVDQIDNIFKELDTLRANNWIEKKRSVDVVDRHMNNNGVKPRKMVVPRVQSAGAEEARKKREAQRKQMIEDRRKAMRQQLPARSIEIYVPESSS